MKKNDEIREAYLTKFERNNSLEEFGVSDGEKIVGTKLVDLMKKEDLTYDSAYASLQYAYNLLKYESNFLKLPSNKKY